MPLTSELWFAAAVFTASFSVVGVMTNQIHQWAHMRKAPRPVRWLQRLGVILSHEAHEQHHRPPYVANYCITTGWCNGLLQSSGFFSRLEQLVSFCTGVQPRFDEQVFSETVARGGIGHE
jgi:ubiquitin-conjugating enzyme E2 variant